MRKNVHTGLPARPIRRSGWVATAAATAVWVAGCGGGDDDVATPTTPSACSQQVNDTEEKLLSCVTLAGVRAHLDALDAIAKANGNTRVSGGPGHLASVEYAEKVFADAGYTVARTSFTFVTFEDNGNSVLRQLSPTPAADIAHAVMSYAGTGTVTAAPVTVVPNLGCDASDFATFTAGHVALIRRGTCPFGTKAANALAAAASGVVIYNNTEGQLNGTLGDTFTADLPVVSVTQAVGEQLAAIPGLTVSLSTNTTRTPTTTYNVIAESAGGDAANVVMVGAHLDSVAEGPGINDNGSGSAAVLETAVQLARVTPKHKLRFALWGAEESGLLGSTNYVTGLTESARAQIALYLNFDMLASPNPGFFIYDGDDSDASGAGAGPDGSAAIEKTFEAFYTARGKAFKGTDFDGRSDYGPFIANGIPAGGLFSGAEGLKTADEAALWGGTAGAAYDPCYHAACDDLSNLDFDALALNAQAVAASTLKYANSLDGVRATATGRAQARSAPATAYVPPADMRPKHLPVLK